MVKAIGTVIAVIFLAVIAGFVWYAAQRLLSLVTLAEPFRTIVDLLLKLVLLLIVLWAVAMLLQGFGLHVPVW